MKLYLSFHLKNLLVQKNYTMAANQLQWECDTTAVKYSLAEGSIAVVIFSSRYRTYFWHKKGWALFDRPLTAEPQSEIIPICMGK